MLAGWMILPVGARSALRDAVRRLNTRYEPRRPMDPALRRRLEAHYAPEIDRLAGLLDRDLGGWLEPVPDGVARGPQPCQPSIETPAKSCSARFRSRK